MKKIYTLIFAFFISISFAQVSPTLGVGLETLTMNKGTIDVQVLTEIIMEKQRELKQEALKRFMFKMFPETNYTTKFYVQNCLNILLNEKNPQVIEKEILELTTNYALALGVTQALIKSENDIFKDLNNEYLKLKDTLDFDLEIEKLKKLKIRDEKRAELKIKINKYTNELNNLLAKNKDIIHQETEIELSQDLEEKKRRRESLSKDLLSVSKEIKDIKFCKVKKKLKKLKKYKSKLSKIEFRNRLYAKEVKKNDSIKVPFGILLDVVSLSLSENENVTKKGFFKNKIDYRKDNFYNDISYKTELDSLNNKIKNKINPYIEHYDVIKEFLVNSKGKKSPDIIKELTLLSANSFNFDELKIENIENVMIKKEVLYLSKCLSMKETIESIKINKVKFFLDKNNIKKDINKATIVINSIVENYNNQYDNYNKVISEDSVYKKMIKISSVNVHEIKKEIKKEIDSINFKIEIEKDSLILKKEIKKLNLLIKNTNLDNFISLESLNDELKSKNGTLKNDDLKSKIAHIDTLKKTYIKKIDSIFKYTEKLVDLSNDTILYNNLKKLIVTKKEDITKSASFYNNYLNEMLKTIETNTIDKSTVLDTISKTKISKFVSNLHSKISFLINNSDISLNDINYLEKEVVKNLIEIKYRDYNVENKKIYDTILNQTKLLIPLLKIQLLSKIDNEIIYKPELASLFEFISNLDNLDKAQTYESIINLLREYSQSVENELADGKFKDSYKIFINGMKKYTLINPVAEKQYVEIDIVSFINDLQQFYNRNNPSRFSLYLTLGLNQNFFFSDFNFPEPNTETIKNISFASEKIGIKWKFHDLKKFSGYENVIKDGIYLNKRAPFVNELYGIIYGSGLLYSLANTSTNENFDFPHVGLGVGLRFYNSLDLNLTLGFPFVKGSNFGDNAFWGIGLDIPLGEYLERLGNKN